MTDPLADVIRETLAEWRPDYPWPPGDPHVVAGVAAFAVLAHLAAVLAAERRAWEAIRDVEDANIPGALASDTIVRHEAVGALNALGCLTDALGVASTADNS